MIAVLGKYSERLDVVCLCKAQVNGQSEFRLVKRMTLARGGIQDSYEIVKRYLLKNFSLTARRCSTRVPTRLWKRFDFEVSYMASLARLRSGPVRIMPWYQWVCSGKQD